MTNYFKTFRTAAIVWMFGAGMTGVVFGQCACMMRYMAESNRRPNPGFKCDDTTPSIWYLKSTTGIAKWSSVEVGYACSGYSESGNDDGTVTTIDPNTLGNSQPDSYTVSYEQYSALSTTTYGGGSYGGVGQCGGGSWSGTKNTTDGSWSPYAPSEDFSSWGNPTVNPNTCKDTVSKYSYDWSDQYGDYGHHSATVESKKETPYTDSELKGHVIAVIPPFPDDTPDNWSIGNGGKAFYQMESDHSWIACGRMKYKVVIPDSIKGATYTVEWYQDTTDNITGKLLSHDRQTVAITGTGDPVNPAEGGGHFVNVPGSLVTIQETVPIVTKVTYSSSGGNGPPGSGGMR